MAASLTGFRILILISVIPFLFYSCKKNENISPRYVLEIDTDLVAEELSGFVTNLDSAYFIGHHIEFADTLAEIYKSRSYEPLFIESDGFAPLGVLMQYLSFAFKHGIDPLRYDTTQLGNLADRVNDTVNRKIDYKTAAELDYLAANAFLRYQRDILYGVIDPRSLEAENYEIPAPVRNSDPFINLISDDRIETLENIQPKNLRYISLQNALETEVKKAKSLKLKKIRTSAKKIEYGDYSEIIPLIAENLISLGYLDTTFSSASGHRYDTILFSAVKQFQKNYGLLDDGVIGKNTIDWMNLLPEDKVNLIKLNLERFRWTSYTDSGKYVLVNIPDFHVYGYSENRQKVKIKVCVGQKREKYYEERKKLYARTGNWHHRPKNFETPQVYSRIDMIITNPAWNVPTSIAKNETYYEIMKDSTYLRRLGFKVFKGNEQVDFTKVNWKEYSPNNLPFNFVQDPGGANALGRLKFMFNNKFAIYLHDTPTRPPFSTLPRAVSHGCVRVEKPLHLAEFILEGEPQLKLDFIKLEIGVKPEDDELLDRYYLVSRKKAATKLNQLSNSVPVYVDYFTSWVDESGKLQFRPDIYEKDKPLLSALRTALAINN